MEPIEDYKVGDTRGGIPVNADLVIWNGKSIEQFGIKTGQPITKGMHKMACELLKIMEVFDIKSYDLPCFTCPPPVDMHDLFQMVFNKVCTCCDGDSDGSDSYEADLTQAQVAALLAQGYTVELIG